MKVPPEMIGQVITILMAAQMRGFIDLRGLGPLLQIIVDSGNAAAVRGLLGEISELLERVEQGQSIR